MVKRGVYCSLTKTEFEETHGGTTTKDSFYHHLCFYLPEKTVGFYAGSKMWLNPYRDRSFRYNGQIETMSDAEIVFTVNDPMNKDKWLFEGRLVNELLLIKATRHSQPEKTWFEGFFEYIGG